MLAKMRSAKAVSETRDEDEFEPVLSWRPARAGGLRRRTEEIQYWRQRSGWFDDDQSMREYNKGVYDAYYEVDDDGARSSHRSRAAGGKQKEVAKSVLKVLAILVALGLTIMMFRAISRCLGSGKREKKDRSGSDSRSRSGRSKSRSRSRSRSRKAGSDYNLMEDDERSKRSSRSKSRSRRISRSRSRQRSSSKSRSESRREEPTLEPVLV